MKGNHDKTANISENDQLVKILETLGPQSEKTMNDFQKEQRLYIGMI